MKLNEKLKSFRIERGLSQRELAKKIGISVPTLQKYEYGTLNLKTEIIIKLCDIFNISLDEFIKKVELNEEEKKEITLFESVKDLLNDEKEFINENLKVAKYIIDNSFIEMTQKRKLLLYFLAHILEFNIPKNKNTLEILYYDSDFEEFHTLIKIDKLNILLDILEKNIVANLINFLQISSSDLLQEALNDDKK